MKVKNKLLILFLFCLIVMSYTVMAVSIGISPGRVSYADLLQSGYAEREIKITTNTEDAVSGHFVIKGDIKDWIGVEPNTDTFTMTKSNPYKLKLIIQPPGDIRNGNYSGSIEFITDTVGSVTGRAGGIVKAAVTMMLDAEVTGKEIVKCRAGGFYFRDTEVESPFEFGATVINDGNVRLSPTFTIDIWDQYQDELILSQEVTGDEILPTTERTIFRRIPNNLGIGQYWVNIGIKECGAEEILTFSIVEKGGIIDKGILIEIFNKAWVSVGETVEIIARFSNSGQRAVNARFKGNIKLDDKIVEVIETEEILVPASDNADFNFFYTPDEPGRYVISGRVIYNKKLTYEKSSILNVEPVYEDMITGWSILDLRKNALPLALYIAIIITIVFLVRKIVKERRKKRIF